MKKLNILLFIMLCLVIAGCGKKNDNKEKDQSKEVLDKAIANMQELKSATNLTEATVTMAGMSVEMSVNGDIDFEKIISHSFDTAMGVVSENYYIVQDDIIYTYTREEDVEEWLYYAEAYRDVELKYAFNKESFIYFINNYKSVKEVESDKKDFLKLEVKTSNETFLNLLEIDDESLITDIVVYVYIKDDYIHHIDLSFDAKIKDSGVSMDFTLDMKITYSNFNDIKPFEPPYKDLEKAIYYNEEDATALNDYFNSIIDESGYMLQNSSKIITFCSGKEPTGTCDIDATAKGISEKKAGGGAKAYIKYKGDPIYCDSITMSKDYNIHLKGCSIGDGKVKYNWSTEASAYPLVVEDSIQSLKDKTVY